MTYESATFPFRGTKRKRANWLAVSVGMHSILYVLSVGFKSSCFGLADDKTTSPSPLSLLLNGDGFG